MGCHVFSCQSLLLSTTVLIYILWQHAATARLSYFTCGTNISCVWHASILLTALNHLQQQWYIAAILFIALMLLTAAISLTAVTLLSYRTLLITATILSGDIIINL